MYIHKDYEGERPTLLPKLFWALVLGLTLAGCFYASKAGAQPMFAAQAGDVRITLYDEPCRLKEVVTNLPYRVVWSEKGKEFEGCFGPNPELGVVMTYFSGDKTVAAIPIQMFKKLVGV